MQSVCLFYRLRGLATWLSRVSSAGFFAKSKKTDERKNKFETRVIVPLYSSPDLYRAGRLGCRQLPLQAVVSHVWRWVSWWCIVKV